MNNLRIGIKSHRLYDYIAEFVVKSQKKYSNSLNHYETF